MSVDKSELQELRIQRDNLSNLILEQAKEVFNKSVKDLFVKHPKLEAFSWTQYTPYFNDGDECTFGVNNDCPLIQYGDDEELDYFAFSLTHYVSDGTEEYKDWKGNTQTRTKYKKVTKVNTAEDIEKNVAYEAVREFLGEFEEEDYRFMFGDHVEIKVSRDEGVEVGRYSHE